MRKTIIAIFYSILYLLIGLFMGIDIMQMAYAEEVSASMIVKFVLRNIPALFAVVTNTIICRRFLEFDEEYKK